MDLEFFNRILSVDSTSGKEGGLADMLSVEFSAPGRKGELFEVGDGTKNLLSYLVTNSTTWAKKGNTAYTYYIKKTSKITSEKKTVVFLSG